jgi:hypothetical protein
MPKQNVTPVEGLSNSLSTLQTELERSNPDHKDQSIHMKLEAVKEVLSNLQKRINS